MKLSNDQKFEILKETYLEQRKEAAFWRERSWKVTVWLIGLFLAISAATVFTNSQHPVLVLPMLGLAAVATFYLHKNYKVYSDRWKNVSRVENAFGFFTKDEYVPGDTLLPTKLLNPVVTYKGTAFFMASIWIVAISASIAVIWK
jgi:hypothetical protein